MVMMYLVFLVLNDDDGHDRVLAFLRLQLVEYPGSKPELILKIRSIIVIFNILFV